MSRQLDMRRGPVSVIRKRLLAVTCQSERTIMLGTILLVSAVSAATGYVLTQYFGIDVFSSLTTPPEDCDVNWGSNIGRHCFSDYAVVVGAATTNNPWIWEPFPSAHAPLQFQYTAAAMLPQLLFGLPLKWLGGPRLGLIGYQLALTIAVLSPAVWASRGTRGIERVVIFVALGAAAIPVWAVIDRGNSAGFLVPIGLVFLVALCRRRWGLVAIMVVLAALVKPQFAVLIIVLLAARQWRLGGLAVAGIGVFNIAAYLLWPQDFPQTITQTIHNLFFVDNSSSSSYLYLAAMRNVSFGRALVLIPDKAQLFQTGKIPDGFLAGPRWLAGYAILVLVVVAVLSLGRRIPPVMVGIVLLATATLFPPVALMYYLVFVLPIAAVVVRDPDGPPGAGIFDKLATHGDRRRAVGICVSLAAALTIAQIVLPGPVSYAAIPGQTTTRGVVDTTMILAPFLWMIACAVIIISYARRSIPSHDTDQGPAREAPTETAEATSSYASEPTTESLPQGPA
jgi:glycosyl transferase family 87